MPNSPCQGCAQDCAACSGCPAGVLYLTPQELEMLRRFGQTPFLPVARAAGDETPVYLEETARTPEEYGLILRHLEAKGLISLDYDLPLSNFDYAPYAAWPLNGSMALTAAGQDALDSLDLLGAEA